MEGTVILHVPRDEFRFRTSVGVVPNLVISLLLGKTYTDRFIRTIISKERKVFPFHSRPIFIFTYVPKTESKSVKTQVNVETTDADLDDGETFSFFQ